MVGSNTLTPITFKGKNIKRSGNSFDIYYATNLSQVFSTGNNLQLLYRDQPKGDKTLSVGVATQ